MSKIHANLKLVIKFSIFRVNFSFLRIKMEPQKIVCELELNSELKCCRRNFSTNLSTHWQ